MKKIIAKPVGMFELFYDLVFVYAISRITAIIHHPVNGTIPFITFAQFLLVVIVIMQVWFYESLYFNRYAKNRFGDILGLLFSMFVTVYVANNINTTWETTFHYFNLAMMAMLVDLILQYAIGAGNDKKKDNYNFVLILSLELIMVSAGVLLGYDIGIYFVVIGYLIGFLLPIFMYNSFQAQYVNFPHLIERVGLIIIISFGEAIVNLTSYFNSKTPIIYAILLFTTLCLMFTSYVLFSERIIHHHQASKGFLLMYSHITLVVAILLLTVGIIYLNTKGINLNNVAWLLTGAVGL